MGPRPSNTGVYPCGPVTESPTLLHRWDWYRASVPASPQLVLLAIQKALEARDGVKGTLTPGRPRYSFKQAEIVSCASGHRVCEVLYGGQNPNPCVDASGESAQFVADILRENGTHYVSRGDVAVDRSAPGLFTAWTALALKLAKLHGLQCRVVSSPTDLDAGSTVYLGSRKSEVFLRVYERGKKVARDEGVAPDLMHLYRDAVRAELEFKPQKRLMKQALGSTAPEALWGVTVWLQDFAREAFAMNAEPINFRQRREADHERALRAVGTQYGRHLERLYRDCGYDDAQSFRTLRDYAGIPDHS